MAPLSTLEHFVREQYYEIGIDDNGQYIGGSKFKEKLFQMRPGQAKQIRQAVNKWVTFSYKKTISTNHPTLE